jgi:peptidoglycan/LPS O-acetylase OafA/YrhL
LFSGLIIGNWWTLGYYFKYFNGQGIGACIYQILTNIFILGQDIVMFLAYNPNTGALSFTNNFLNTEPGFWEFLLVPQAWTLGIEIAFYLIAPFIVRRQTWLIICLILSSLGLRLFIYFYLGWYQDPWTYRFFPTEIALFLMGTLSYRIYSSNQGNKNRKFSITISIMLLLSILAYQFFPDFALKKWLLYILTTISIPFLFKTFKHSSLDAKIGEYSYPVYIVHELIILYVTPFTRRLSLESSQGGLVAVLSFFAAYFLIKYIANPIELVRKKRIEQLS